MKLKANSVSREQATRRARPLDRTLLFLDPLILTPATSHVLLHLPNGVGRISDRINYVAPKCLAKRGVVFTVIRELAAE